MVKILIILNRIRRVKKNKETALYHANYMKRAALIIKEHLDN